MIPFEFFLVLGAILFVIGAYGVMTKSNAIIVLMCIATTIIAPPILSILYKKKYKTNFVVSDQDKL